MIRLELVKDTFGADYTGDIAYVNLRNIASYVIEKPSKNYPKCVKILVNDRVYRVRFSDFKKLHLWKVINEYHL